MSDVERWLDDLGLGQYAPTFAENLVDFGVLPQLTSEDLEGLGIAAIGHRRKILSAIESLRNNMTMDIVAAEATPSTSRSVAPNDAERRQLTVMFCDMVGSTALSARLDPEDYREVIRTYQDACAGVITRFDGYVARYMGDGVLAYFGWPRAHEDDAARAISAGLGLVDAVAGLAAPYGDGQPIAVRIGIATGPVVIGDIVGEGGSQEAAATGETLNLAARLEVIAAANTVVISNETHALASGLFDYETLGPQTLKGIDGTPEVWRVVCERQVESRFAAAHATALTPLIGREEELELLSRRWEQAKGGDGQVTLASGEPGIGKSRLTQALQDWIGDEVHTRLLLQCSPHHTSSALYPVINQLEIAARFVSGDSATTRLDKLRTLLAQAGEPTDETVALMAALLSIPAEERYPLPQLTPQQQKDRTLAALNDHLAGLTIEKPVLFVLEDAHWIDPSTLELMELTIERIRELPVLVVITYRPEFVAPWIGEDHVTLLALNRLARKERTQMAAALIGETALSQEVLTQIGERSDGIPLFIEELTRSIQESGGSTGIAGEQATAAGVDIPATLQDALEARFDRSPAVRELAQVGAAIGREFRYDLLAHVAALPPAELHTALDDLVGSGLVFARGSPPNASYTFKHALIQDTAYDSMIRSKRQETHKRIAENLLRLQPEITETEPETLAHHYTEAWLLEEAVDWWTRAGESASAKSVNPEAFALLGRGLDLIAKLPESDACDQRELVLQTALFGPLITVKGQTSPELEAAFNRTLELCEKIDAPDAWFRATATKWLFHAVSEQIAAAFDVAQTVLQRAELTSDEGALLMGHNLLGRSLFLLGRPLEGLVHLDQVPAMFNRERHGHLMLDYGQDPELLSESFRAVSLWLLGWPDASRDSSNQAVSQALKLGHLTSLGPTLCWGGSIPHLMLRDVDAMRQIGKHFDFLISQHDMPVFKVWAQTYSSVVESLAHPSLHVASALRHGINLITEASRGPTMVLPLFYCHLAEAYIALRDPAQALEEVTTGFEFAEASGERWYEAEIHRIRGVALAMADGSETNGEAETSMLRAIEVAKAQSAKSLELRAATSLARFLLDQGRPAEARGTLAPVYGWFTEGFDTPDLKDAKALLDELS